MSASLARDPALAHVRTRRLLYAENFLITFAVGIFLILPLYFQAQGRNEVFFGQVFAVGAVGAVACVLASHWLLRRLGLARLAPWGSLLFCAGSGLYLFSAAARPSDEWLLYSASLLQGVGWGLFLTQGSLCMSSTSNDIDRSYHFTVYGAYNTLGIGLAPIACSIAMNRFGAGHVTLFGVATLTSFAAFLISARAAHANAGYLEVGKLAGAQPGADAHGVIHVFRLPSVFFLAMVMLCACVYTSMTNFQATFAAAMHIDYTVFFGCYTLAVVSARFGLARTLSQLPASSTVPGLALLMVLALALLFGAKTSVLFYAAGALLLGISYGLLYPTLQAQAVNYAPVALKPQALIAYSLSYLLLRYLFPYLGAVAVQHHGYDGLLTLLLLCATLSFALGAYFFAAGPGRVRLQRSW